MPDFKRAWSIPAGAPSIQLELSAYVLKNEDRELLEAREDLLRQVGEIMDNSGSGFAVPPQLAYAQPPEETYVERKSGPEIQGHGSTEGQVLSKRAS
jgi:hypothetical protein